VLKDAIKASPGPFAGAPACQRENSPGIIQVTLYVTNDTRYYGVVNIGAADYSFTEHAMERVAERGVTTDQIKQVMRYPDQMFRVSDEL
jgi:hypothetical protein